PKYRAELRELCDEGGAVYLPVESLAELLDAFDELETRALASRQRVPDGWVMVPKEPTHTMRDVGETQDKVNGDSRSVRVYRAMIEQAIAESGGE
ncbi:MAG TPA: hypothetical protein VKA19_11510, partial [Alphaproteobacteria bacterium]|nr:hypothetical protein [Alphaproteobacteria bacterium]